MPKKLWKDREAMLRDFGYFDAAEVEAMKAQLPAAGPGITVSEADAIVRIAHERAAVALAMKEALVSGDDAEALRLARVYCGLPKKEER